MACNDNSNCIDSCDQIDGLFEAASNLVQYRDIIEKWLNGKQNETVQIGGEQVKTLLGLIADIKQLVGVLPDGRTIILDDKRKVLSVLLAEGGGIKVKDEGGLYVDVNDILVLGGGLAKDEDGKIYVDFSQMPTDKFEALLKQIRVPIWLTANKNFYVNAETGSDTLDEGRGESEEKPFRTIQACVDYVCDNYNLSKYNVTIKCLSKKYIFDSTLILGSYSSSSGYIIIEGLPCDGLDSFQTTFEISDKTLISHDTAKTYKIKALNYILNMSSDMKTYGSLIRSGGGGVLYIDGFKFDVNIIGEFSAKKDLRTIYSYNGSTINLQNNHNIKCSASINNYHGTSFRIVESLFTSRTSGYIVSLGALSSDYAKISCSGKAAYFALFAGGYYSVNVAYKYPMVFEGTFYGMRYYATNNGYINTQGGGPEFFPGDTPGTVDASTYSWYK